MDQICHFLPSRHTLAVMQKNTTNSQRMERRLFVRLDSNTHEKLARLAKAQRRPVAQLVRNLLTDSLETELARDPLQAA